MEKKAIIIGASSGIGRALALLYAGRGYKVGITGRRAHLLHELRNSNPSAFIVKCFDIDDTASVYENLNQLVAELDGVSVVILSSGTGKRNPELNPEYEIETIKTNVAGFTVVSTWAYNFFEKQGYGNFAAISSIAGLRGFALSPSYSSSKGYQMRYLESLRQKARNSGKNIFVTDIRAGFVDTAMGQGEGAFWKSSPEVAAEQIFKAICRRKGIVYVTGRWFFVALLMRLVPNFIFEQLKL